MSQNSGFSLELSCQDSTPPLATCGKHREHGENQRLSGEILGIWRMPPTQPQLKGSSDSDFSA